MANYYQNGQGFDPNLFVYDQNGNIVGVRSQSSTYQPSPMTAATTPSWWPKPQSQQQNTQQQFREPSIIGKWIQAPNDVVPMDVPQDGSIAMFPQKDLQVIFLKKWEANGTITTVPYIPNVTQEQKGQTPEQQFQENIQDRLTNIERALDSLINYISQPVQQPQTNSRSKNSSKEDSK